ncbi:MAG: hypothetical protein C4542_08880 [Dehalococcoidia bacterium]|nr:MAG: hypothetical protein C4542_08880 [Dehalococcoidia bacterium]
MNDFDKLWGRLESRLLETLAERKDDILQSPEQEKLLAGIVGQTIPPYNFDLQDVCRELARREGQREMSPVVLVDVYRPVVFNRLLDTAKRWLYESWIV